MTVFSPTTKTELIALAVDQGFALCRVARCDPPRHGEAFLEWLAQGQAGDMAGWLGRSREKRTNPDLVLPGARSVVVLAMNYWQGSAESTVDSPAAPGRIARYAWGDDYHDMIRSRLGVLDEVLIRHGGRQRCYVDTGPVLERDFAAEAGVGWHGKSTMLLHPELGTFFFLAVILTTLELEADSPIPPRCGTCTACLDACPTGAIRPETPYHLDARLCISYLTIEHKGSIPEELRPLLGERIYGCDECLDVCPWNRFAAVSRETSFQARPATIGYALRDYLALDEPQFAALFRGSPILRTKRRGLLRNVCVALGNVGNPSDLPALERAAGDPEPLIAEHARWAVGRIRLRHPAVAAPAS